MGEKGIESFFANHVCNAYCNADGRRWQRPRAAREWFPSSSATSMMASKHAHMLNLNNTTRFQPGFDTLMEKIQTIDRPDERGRLLSFAAVALKRSVPTRQSCSLQPNVVTLTLNIK